MKAWPKIQPKIKESHRAEKLNFNFDSKRNNAELFSIWLAQEDIFIVTSQLESIPNNSF